MSEGSFWCSYDECVSLLRTLNLFKADNRHQGWSYSEGCKEYSRSGEYREIYQQMVDNRDYDILLSDDSILQMNITEGESRLLFIQNPLEYLTFEAFLSLNGWNYTEDTIFELRGLFNDEYEQARSMMRINSGATYMRYDVDSRGRQGNENIHAFTHLHIGLNNNIRIPIGLHLTPLAFVVFVIRHVYYDDWANAIRQGTVNLDYKRYCESLPEDVWTESERTQLFIS